MSMIMMPLVIKVKMTESNYTELVKEAKTHFQAIYVDTRYKHDGEYFTLHSCAMDDATLNREAAMIARYSEKKKQKVGIIFVGPYSYMTAELIFKNGSIELGKKLCEEHQNLSFGKQVTAAKKKYEEYIKSTGIK